MGDYTLASDVREALGIPAAYDLPEENYTGPLFANLGIPLEERVRAHLKRPGPSIYFAMGSSGNKELYLRALRCLAGTRYNVVAAYTTILSADELPPVGENVLLEKFVPAEIVNKMADIAVLHGGQGTFYTAAYSGRPVVGIPMQFEQQYNIDILVRRGSAIRVSKRHFREEALLRAIEAILADYPRYRASAEALAKCLPVIDGAVRGAERIRAIAIEHSGESAPHARGAARS
jgi:UDP:flavonoid glycosyltransferase YjiC (YdhE family)